MPPTPEALEARITELEIKASFTEDMLDQLNQVIVQQQARMDLLLRELTALREQARSTGLPGVGSPPDERPPHY